MHTEGKDIKGGKIVSNKKTAKILIGIVVVMILGGAFIDWFGFILLAFAGTAVVLALNSVVIVPTVHFGIPTRFKERIKDENGKIKTITEGLNLVAPLIDDLLPGNLESKELTPEEINTNALSLDKLEISIGGSVQYKVDDLDVFIEMTPKAIKSGMVDAVKSELGNIAGTKEADAFIKNRPEVEMLIKSILQLERAPHYYINKVNDSTALTTNGKKFSMGNVLKELLNQNVSDIVSKSLDEVGKSLADVVDKLSPEKWEIKEEVIKDVNGNDISTGEIDKMAFYKDNASRISTLFEIEDLLKNRKSPVEKLYGIKVATFRLAKLNFSEAAQKAFEEKKSTTARMEAADTRHQKKLSMIKDYINAGLSKESAENIVETTTDTKGVERQIISVEGSQSADLLAAAKLFSGSTAKGGGKK